MPIFRRYTFKVIHHNEKEGKRKRKQNTLKPEYGERGEIHVHHKNQNTIERGREDKL